MQMKTMYLCAALATGAATASLLAQVPVQKEPHHKQLIYTAHMRVFDVNVPAGRSTEDHTHEYDMITVAIGDSTSRSRSGGQTGDPAVRPSGHLALAEHTGKPSAHILENTGQAPLRLIAVENVRDAGWTKPTPLQAPATSLAQESRSFGVYEVRLNDATKQTAHRHEVPTVVVLVSGSYVFQGDGGSEPFRVDDIGRWVYSPPNNQHTLSVPAGSEARLIEFEAR
ncbi:MAG: hypothetical protein AB7I50_09100 [Vicinamibacterales bacterium]